MAKLIVPMHLFDSGYAGAVNNLKLNMYGESTGFEVHKAFTTDDREYLKITDGIDLAYPFVKNGTQAIFLLSDDFLSDETNKLYLYKDTTENYLSSTLKTPIAVYGDGAIESTYFTAATALSGLTKSIIIYPADNQFQYYRILISPISSQRIQSLMHGIIYDLPDGYRLSNREYGYKYSGSIIKTNLVGNIFFDGVQNNGVKRSHTLSYEYLSETDKDFLLDIFKLGKGGLPMLFADDVFDNRTWMIIGIKSMSVTEKYAGYYDITLNIQEY